MRLMLKARFFVGLCALAVVGAASALSADDQATVNLLFRSVLNTENGFINKARHDEFWRFVHKEAGNDPAAIAKFVRDLDQFKILLSSYPYETWKSIRLSYDQRRVVRTPEFIALSSQLRPWSQSAAESVDSAERFLVAAANRDRMPVKGETRYIDDELIDQVTQGIEGANSRMDRLLKQDWSEEMSEQVIPGVRVTILTLDLFTVRKERVPNGGTASVATRVTGEISMEQVGLIVVPGGKNSDLGARGFKACQGAFRTISVPCNGTPITWRGHQAIRAVAVSSVEGVPIAVAGLFVQREADNAIQLFLTITPGTALDAGIALDTLLNRTKPE